jgi:hypothetical protein
VTASGKLAAFLLRAFLGTVEVRKMEHKGNNSSRFTVIVGRIAAKAGKACGIKLFSTSLQVTLA